MGGVKLDILMFVFMFTRFPPAKLLLFFDIYKYLAKIF